MFKVGDKVFSYQFGWGIVEDVLEDLMHMIKVSFTDVKIVFTKCGRAFSTDLHPTLSFTEYDLVNGGFSQERPRDTVTEEHIGKLVRVLDDCEYEGFLGVLERITHLGYFEVNGFEFENVELYEQN